MFLFISLSFVGLWAYFCPKHIKKYAPFYCAASTLMAGYFTMLTWTKTFKAVHVFPRNLLYLFSKGGMTSALFIIVMILGILPRKSKFRKRVMPIRAELSIIASILTLGHNFTYGKHYFTALFLGKTLSPRHVYASIISIVMIAIMLPLFITSFNCVRKRMRAATWKKLQRSAYAFYFLLWLHVTILYLSSAHNGNVDSLMRLCFYHALYGVYIYAKLKVILKHEQKKRIAAGIACAFLIISLAITFVPIKTSVQMNIHNKENASENIETTTQIEQTTIEVESEETTSETAAEHATETTTEMTTEAEEVGYKDGEYFGTAMGYVDDITVKVIVENHEIKKVVITEEQEDLEYIEIAEDIVYDIAEQNTPNVDTISGATTSCEGIINAVKNALEQAN